MRMETFETSELNDNSHIRISKVKKYKTMAHSLWVFIVVTL